MQGTCNYLIGRCSDGSVGKKGGNNSYFYIVELYSIACCSIVLKLSNAQFEIQLVGLSCDFESRNKNVPGIIVETLSAQNNMT